MVVFSESPDAGEARLGDEAPPTGGDMFTGDDENTIDASPSAEAAPWLIRGPITKKRVPWRKLNATGSPHKIELALTCLARVYFRYGPDKRPDPVGAQGIVGKLLHGAREDAATRRIRRHWKTIPSVASVAELLHLLEYQPASLAAPGDGEDGERGDPLMVSGAALEEAREITITAGGENYSHTWAVEHPWTLRNLCSGFSPGGYIDQIDHEGGRPDAPKRVTITDYKSSYALPEREELYYAPAPGLYMAWAKARWPMADVRFRLRNLRLNETMWLRWTPAHDAFHRAQARSAYRKWSSNLRTQSAGDHCRYCPYREGDGRYAACAAYERLLSEARYASAHPGGLERHRIEEIMRIYREATVGIKVSETRKSDARKVILDKLGDETRYAYVDLLAYVTRDRLPVWENLWEFLHELAAVAGVQPADLFADLFAVKPKGLAKWAASVEDGELKALVDRKIDEYRTLSQGQPKLTVRRTKSMF